jgi:hypothetical protein
MAQATAVNSKNRDKIVPTGENAVSDPASDAEAERPATRCYRLSWSALWARIFSIDACQCECGGRMMIVAAITDPASEVCEVCGRRFPLLIPQKEGVIRQPASLRTEISKRKCLTPSFGFWSRPKPKRQARDSSLTQEEGRPGWASISGCEM